MCSHLYLYREYEDGMEELAPVSVLDVVMALQRQGAIGQFKNSRSAFDRPCISLSSYVHYQYSHA